MTQNLDQKKYSITSSSETADGGGLEAVVGLSGSETVPFISICFNAFDRRERNKVEGSFLSSVCGFNISLSFLLDFRPGFGRGHVRVRSKLLLTEFRWLLSVTGSTSEDLRIHEQKIIKLPSYKFTFVFI